MKNSPLSSRRQTGKFLTALAVLLLAALAVGCGSKGDLVRPGTPPATLQQQ